MNTESTIDIKHIGLSAGISRFIKKSMDVMAKEYGRHPERLQLRYHVYVAVAEMAYMLSTGREEGNFFTCKIALVGARRKTIGEHGTLIEFKEPFPFRIDVLEKMASSAGVENSYICVTGETPDKLEIIGLYTFNNELDRIRQREVVSGNVGDPLFNIRIKEPGVISSCYGPVEMLEFKGNATYREKPLDEIVGSSIFKAKLFQDSSEVFEYAEDRLDEGFSLARTSCYETTIALILDRMLKLRHGGMLVIVDDDFDDSDDMAIKYRFNNNDLLFGLVKEWQLEFMRALKTKKVINSEIYSKVKSICTFIAQLTSVDGAVVIKKNLQIVGYGAELKSGVSKSTITYYNIDTETMGNFENKGTRHRSGCRYCYQDNEAVVFIVSQDGAITGLTYYDGMYGPKSKEKIPTNMVMLTHGRQILL